MSVFFTSDLHCGHGNIIKYCRRPFMTDADREALYGDQDWVKDPWSAKIHNQRWKMTWEAIQMMNDTIITNINNRVGKDDVLWILGDVLFAHRDKYVGAHQQFRSKIKCQNVHLIWGNHDPRCTCVNFRGENHELECTRRIISNFYSSTQEAADIKVEGQHIVMCHYSFLHWNKSHRGSWALHGHIHSVPPPAEEAEVRRLDVGVDGHNFQPWSFEEIKEYMSKGQKNNVYHHDAPEEESLV